MQIDVVIITYKTGKKLVLPKARALDTIFADFEHIQHIDTAEYVQIINV